MNQYILFKLSVKVINIIKIKSEQCLNFGDFYLKGRKGVDENPNCERGFLTL